MRAVERKARGQSFNILYSFAGSHTNFLILCFTNMTLPAHRIQIMKREMPWFLERSVVKLQQFCTHDTRSWRHCANRRKSKLLGRTSFWLCRRVMSLSLMDSYDVLRISSKACVGVVSVFLQVIKIVPPMKSGMGFPIACTCRSNSQDNVIISLSLAKTRFSAASHCMQGKKMWRGG